MKDSYIKDTPYSDKYKFENHVWSGLQAVLGKDFCATGYFKPFWPEVKKGKWQHSVNGVTIDVEMSRGIFISRSTVVEPVEEFKVQSKSSDSPNVPIFGRVTESGSGAYAEVRFYHQSRQVGYVSTTRLNDETVSTGIDIAKQLKVPTQALSVTKIWVEESDHNDFL